MSHYTEQPPLGPQIAGDVGGDHQISEAFERRFLRDEPDVTGDYVLLGLAFYVEKSDHGDGPLVLTRQTEYMLCTDPDDPGMTEQWADYRYDTLPFDGEPTEADARAACAAVDPARLTWNGVMIDSGLGHPVAHDLDDQPPAKATP